MKINIYQVTYIYTGLAEPETDQITVTAYNDIDAIDKFTANVIRQGLPLQDIQPVKIERKLKGTLEDITECIPDNPWTLTEAAWIEESSPLTKGVWSKLQSLISDGLSNLGGISTCPGQPPSFWLCKYTNEESED